MRDELLSSLSYDYVTVSNMTSRLYDALRWSQEINTEHLAEQMVKAGVPHADSTLRENRIAEAREALSAELKAAVASAELLTRRIQIAVDEINESARHVRR